MKTTMNTTTKQKIQIQLRTSVSDIKNKISVSIMKDCKLQITLQLETEKKKTLKTREIHADPKITLISLKRALGYPLLGLIS